MCGTAPRSVNCALGNVQSDFFPRTDKKNQGTLFVLFFVYEQTECVFVPLQQTAFCKSARQNNRRTCFKSLNSSCGTLGKIIVALQSVAFRPTNVSMFCLRPRRVHNAGGVSPVWKQHFAWKIKEGDQVLHEALSAQACKLAFHNRWQTNKKWDGI